MVSISSGAIITALGAIGPPNIVDLPEFAPVFPTTALFGGLFGALNALNVLNAALRQTGANWREFFTIEWE